MINFLFLEKMRSTTDSASSSYTILITAYYLSLGQSNSICETLNLYYKT